MFRSATPLGARVEQGEPVVQIADPFGAVAQHVEDFQVAHGDI